jgi:FADH2 O2-dependent halogenase
MKRTDSDVIILGSGLAGSIAALCLQRHGLRVTLVDQGTHPRFALGESTTTPASLWLRVLAHTFRVPELLHIASAEAIMRFVAPTSGVKNNFGFAWHRAGAAKPERMWQAIIPQAFLAESEHGRQPANNEMHYFRQDVDAYLWSIALAEGAIGRPATVATDIDFDDRGVTVATKAGETLRAQFLIDASGHRSPVADRLGLRDAEPRMRTNSRSLFTHMIGVRHFEDTKIVPDTLAPWSQGTLHHFFDGGWVWVIPFDNHHQSTNRLCSVGLNLDNRRFPKPRGVSAEEEWQAFLADYPAVRAQFERAVAVRPWVDTGRLQYTSRDCIGDRFWLTSHAAGTVDALYSMGNINTFHTLAIGLPLIVRSFAEQTFRRERLQPLQLLSDRLFRLHDRIVYGNYVATRAPCLLQTWIALWSLTDTARIRRVLMPLVKYLRTGDARDLDLLAGDAASVVTGVGMQTGITDTDTVLDELDALCDIMQELEEGRAPVEEVDRRLREAIGSKSHYHIDLAVIEDVFARLPWAIAPLSRNGLRGHGTFFLTPTEMSTLGMDGSC